MNVAWKHLKTILKHKAIVFRECKSCGIMWQGIKHDLSKLTPAEFLPSARYFQGDRSPIEKEKEEAPATTKICPKCKSEINIEATRCPHCTSEL